MRDGRARRLASRAFALACQASGGAWGAITGTLTDQTDLAAALAGKQAAGSYAAASHGHVISDVTGLQAALDGKQAAGSYQPLASVLSNTTASFTAAQQTKLAGIATAATANSSDATLLDRANHTGSQAQSTITNLVTDLAAKAALASPVFTGNVFSQQAAPVAQNSTATLTIATLLGGLVTATSATAVSLTLPTGTLSDAGILAGALANDRAFEWVLVNLGSSSGAVTLLAGTGHTIVGNAVTAISTSSRWRTRKTAGNTFVTYRIA